jgi:HAD superfamily 5'-nucleotidase-like hydrolase
MLFRNRTLNLRSIRAIGYDMDYTLVHYRVEEWERRAYEHTRGRLVAMGWPVGHLSFDPSMVIRGLTIDLDLGNLVKPTRFGYVIKATHGTRHLEFDALRRAYDGEIVDLSNPRFVFLNTLFSMSEAALYAQLVDLLDDGSLPRGIGYPDLYEIVRGTLDEAHMEGRLKGEILEDPDRFVVPDPDAPIALLDQRHAGKKLLLITNSEWEYTQRMMAYAFDPHLPEGIGWRDLFDTVISHARKPGFFSEGTPFYRVVDEGLGLLKPHVGAIESGDVYVGGSAAALEEHLGLQGGEILYVGDHLYADVSVTKTLLRWRTALVLRELEDEIEADVTFEPTERRLSTLMSQKESLEAELAEARLSRQRTNGRYLEPRSEVPDGTIDDLQARIAALDEDIGPLARAAGALVNESWGPLMRSGNDKSLFARQVERYADVYTSRVSNFGLATPYAYLRAARGVLPHDAAGDAP